jgi:hypothetical protein
MTQGVKEQIVIFATVEPERHFVQVGRKMFGADTMPRPHDSTLEQAESGLYVT